MTPQEEYDRLQVQMAWIAVVAGALTVPTIGFVVWLVHLLRFTH